MCGIVGVVAKGNVGFTNLAEDTFFQLLQVDVIRGEDSTGIIAVAKDKTFHIAKKAVDASLFIPLFRNTDIDMDMSGLDGKALIGHNRKSTVGTTKDETAHPFVIDKQFAMVHNGTLYQHRKLADTEVDSEALATVMARAFKEEDYLPALCKELGEVNGAYACAMYDQRNHKVRLIRNKDRPLAFVETPTGFLWASEIGMLMWIMSRNGYAADLLKNIHIIPEDTLYTIDLATDTLIKEKAKPKKASWKEAASSIPSTVKTTIGDISNYFSKREFRKFKRDLIGTRIQWWCEDFVEKNYPKTEQDGETEFLLMGEYDEITMDNVVHACVDIKALGISTKDFDDGAWIGTVVDVEFNHSTQMLDIFLEHAKPLPFSVTRRDNPSVIDGEYIRNKLDEKERICLATMH